MIAVYAAAIIIGGLAVLAWIVMSVVAANVDGWERYDPDRRGGSWGRRAIAGLVGGGMAGMSATFAGWDAVVAFVAAVIGCVGLAAASDWLTSPGGEPADPDPERSVTDET